MMKKSLTFFIGLFFFLLLASTAFAVEEKPARVPVCLQAQGCLKLSNSGDPSFAQKCPQTYAAKQGNGREGTNDYHFAYFDTAGKGLEGKKYQVMECLTVRNKDGSEGGDPICTTGDSALDRQLFGEDNVNKLKSLPNTTGNFSACNGQYYNFFKFTNNALGAPNIDQKTGQLPIGKYNWQSCSVQDLYRKYYALYEEPIQPAQPTPNLTPNAAQNLGTVPFSQLLAKVPCEPVVWDPYGRTFDSKSLEPIPNVTIELFRKRDDGNFTTVRSTEFVGSYVVNPQSTTVEGSFVFLVPDGIYKLTANGAGYTFPNDPSKLHSNATKIYSDLYPNPTGEEIVEVGGAQHRDIPLDPVDGVGKTYPVKLVTYFYDLDKTNNQAIVDGIVSHPFAKVRAYSLQIANGVSERYRLVGESQADKDGKFVLAVDQTKFSPTEVFGEIEVEKIDLTTFGASTDSVNKTATLKARMKPILNYIAGYAYDSASAAPLPNTTVGIYLTSSSVPLLEVQTDDKGFYNINSSYLPPMPFTVKYTTPTGRRVDVDTEKFVAQNEKYLKEQKINLSSYQGASVQPREVAQKTTPGATSGTPAPTQSTANSSMLLIGLILLILLGGAGIMLAVYLYKKNSTAV